MKNTWFRAICSSIIFAVIALAAITLSGSGAQAQRKGSPPPEARDVFKCVTQTDLDCGLPIVQGKNVFYGLTDAEGGVDRDANGELEPWGRSRPAKIVNIVLKRDANGNLVRDELTGQFTIERNPAGHFLVDIIVFTDTVPTGFFLKERVPYGLNAIGAVRNMKFDDLRGP